MVRQKIKCLRMERLGLFPIKDIKKKTHTEAILIYKAYKNKRFKYPQNSFYSTFQSISFISDLQRVFVNS